MKTTCKSDAQIMYILNQAQADTPVSELCKEYAISTATFTSGVLNTQAWMYQITRLKELEAENAKLKKMYAEEHLKAEIVQEALTKKW